MDIMQLLSKTISDPNALNELSKSVGASNEQVNKVAKLGIPAIMEALNRNSNTERGAIDLSRALDKHSDANIDDVAGFLRGVDVNDGKKILSHVFGTKNSQVQSRLAAQTGMNQNQIGNLLAQFAPMLLGMLGNEKKKKNLDASGVSNLTSMFSSSLSKGGTSDMMGMAMKLLDANGDGDVMDDLGGMVGKFFKK